MKRSRRSEYDKKRDRSEKSSERKLKYSIKSTAKTSRSDSNTVSESKPSSSSSSNRIDRLKDFEITENHEKKYTQPRVVIPKEKSGCFNYRLPFAVVIILFIFKLIMGIGKAVSSSSTTTQTDPFMQEIIQNEKKKRRNTIKINVPDYIVGKNKPLQELMQLTQTGTFPIIPHVEVHLFKGFHIYDASGFANTEILAKFSKYYFFCDRVEKSPNESLTNQWATLRNELTQQVYGSAFSYNDSKSYTYKDLKIEEKEFTILSDQTELQGIATLVEFENTRYFFHFISKEKEGTYFKATFLKKYMDYYLKIR